MRRVLVPLVLFSATMLVAGAQAHPHGWVGKNDGAPHPNHVFVNAGIDCPGADPTPGGVCFPAGEIVPDLIGDATLTVCCHDEAGFYCQDLDGDALCGEPTDPVLGQVEEPGIFFCVTIHITADIDWFPQFPVYVFVQTLAHGLLHECPTFFEAATGTVDHS